MTIQRDPTLWCDECGHWEWCNGRKLAPKIRTAAKKAGWTRRRHEGRLQDICPACSASVRIAAAVARGQEDRKKTARAWGVSKALPSAAPTQMRALVEDMEDHTVDVLHKHHPDASPEEIADALGLDVSFDGQLWRR